MLYKEQANAATDALALQGQASRVKETAPVAWLYRCQALFALAPAQRSAVVQQASKAVNQKSLFFFVTFAWIGVFVLFWLYGMSESSRRHYMGLFILGSWVLPVCFRALLIRREVRKLATRHPRFL